MGSARQVTKTLGQTVLGAVLVVGAGSAWAGNIHRIVDFNNNISLSYVHSHVEYGERLSPPNGPYFDTESGFLNGGRVAFTAMGNAGGVHNIYLHGSYQQTTGDTAYVGGIQSKYGTTPLTQNDNARMSDYAVRIGQGVSLGSWSMLIPFLTYGHHQWLRGQLPTAFAPYDYQEEYRNDYAGFGITWQAMPNRHILTSLTAIYGRTVHPRMDAPALGFGEGLGPKPWMRAGFTVNYIFTRHEAVFAGVRFTKFQYGAGPALVSGGSVLREPFSQTEITDYRIGVRFLV